MLIYISCPYTDPDQSVVNDRVLRAQNYVGKIQAELTRILPEPVYVVCPIIQGHYTKGWINYFSGNKLTHEQWMDIDLTLLDKADVLFVLQMDGWESSAGVKEEIKHATKYSIPIEFFDIAKIKESCENWLNYKFY